jgi:hypothetical protein
MIKSRRASGKAAVTFTLDPRVGARRAAVCGEWNAWSRESHVMAPDHEGGFALTVVLEPGRAYRFRYLLDGERWENDWAADAYVPNAFGGDDSLVDLTALAEKVPPVGDASGPRRAENAAPAKAAAAKKAGAAKKAAAPAKKAGPAKEAGQKAAGPKKAAPAKKAAGVGKAAGVEKAAKKAGKASKKKPPG